MFSLRFRSDMLFLLVFWDIQSSVDKDSVVLLRTHDRDLEGRVMQIC